MPIFIGLRPISDGCLGGLNTTLVDYQAALSDSKHSVLFVAGAGSFSTDTVRRWIVSPIAL